MFYLAAPASILADNGTLLSAADNSYVILT